MLTETLSEDGTSGQVTPGGGRRRRLFGALLDYGVVGVLAALLIALTVLSPTFLTGRNLSNLTGQWAPVGIMAIAATMVIIAGGFDLSMGATFAFTSVVAAWVGTNHSTLVAYGAALALGIGIGLLNGAIIRFGGINPFVATLGTSFIVTGVGFATTDAQPFYIYDGSFSWLGSGRTLGLPHAGILLIVLLVVSGLVLAGTVYGRSLYAIGGNEEASRLAGLKVQRMTVSTYVLSGAAAAFAGIVSASQLGAAQMTTDIAILFDVITVVIIGGTSLAGGAGAIWRTAVGLAILASLGNGFNQLNLGSYVQDIITGLIVLAALGMDRLLQQYRSGAIGKVTA